MDPSVGGPTQGIRNITPSLQGLGIETEVLCLDSPDSHYLETQNFTIHAVGKGTRFWGYHGLLRGWLDTNLKNYDVLILHGLWLYIGWALWRSLKHLATGDNGAVPPYLLYPHGMLDPWFQNARDRRWKALRNRIYWKFIESRIVRDAACILFTCDEEKRLAATTFPSYNPHRELNVGYGVAEPPADSVSDRLEFRMRCPGFRDWRPFMLYLSRIHEKKGVDLLLRAYADLLGQNSTLPDLVIAGPLDSSYARAMQRLAKEIILPGSGGHPMVHFPGMLQGAAKWGAFYSCEAFVLPSHQENFGISVVEALSCGKPVLISDKVNICQEINAAGAGWVREDTLEGTKQLLEVWLENRDNPPPASVVRACYLKHFGVEQAANTLREVLLSYTGNQVEVI